MASTAPSLIPVKCMYVCMNECMYVYMNLVYIECTYVCTYASNILEIDSNVCIYVCMCVYVYMHAVNEFQS